MESITSNQEKQIIRFTEDAARKAAEEVLAGLSLKKEIVQKAVIENGDELQSALIPVISVKLGEFIAEKTESFEVMKASILIRAGGSNPYFDEAFDYWVELWRKKLGIKNPNFVGIKPFVAHPGYRPLILPKSDLVTAQYLYDCCRERFNCWKWTNQSLDKVVIRNDRDPRNGAYVAWFRDRVEADEELKNLSANQLEQLKTPGIILLERQVLEYDHFERTNGHLDIVNRSLCSGSRDSDSVVPFVHWLDGKLVVGCCLPDHAFGLLRARQQFSF